MTDDNREPIGVDECTTEIGLWIELVEKKEHYRACFELKNAKSIAHHLRRLQQLEQALTNLLSCVIEEPCSETSAVLYESKYGGIYYTFIEGTDLTSRVGKAIKEARQALGKSV